MQQTMQESDRIHIVHVRARIANVKLLVGSRAGVDAMTKEIFLPLMGIDPGHLASSHCLSILQASL